MYNLVEEDKGHKKRSEKLYKCTNDKSAILEALQWWGKPKNI